MSRNPLVCVQHDAFLCRFALQIDKERRKLEGVDYWKNHGDEHSPHLRSLAQAVFGAPSSAGVIERDFSVADMFQPRKRGSVDPANLEMTLYLRGQFENIPADVPELTEEQAEKAVPRRFTDRKMLEEVEVLNFKLEREIDTGGDEDFSWEEKYPQEHVEEEEEEE